MHITIKDLPECDRPYEKFLKYGPDSLSDTELLAVILKTGTRDKTAADLARAVMLSNDNTYSLLSIHRKSYEELTKIPGIGSVKAITLKCVAELSKRIVMARNPVLSKFASPSVIAEHYMEDMRHLMQEELRVIYLDSGNNFICDKVITIGTINKSLVSAREIFIKATQVEAVYIILVHNHPSGNPTPSEGDIAITEIIAEAGRIMSIQLLDHIIIGDMRYVSLREEEIVSF